MPGVAVADQDDVVQVLSLDQVDDVGDVGVQVDLGRGLVGAVPQPGERHRVDLVALAAELVGDRLPGPTAEPGPWDENVGGHAGPFSS